MPEFRNRTQVTLRVGLFSADDELLSDGELTFEVFPAKPNQPPTQAVVIFRSPGEENCQALAEELGLAFRIAEAPAAGDNIALAGAWPEDPHRQEAWVRWVEAGGTLVLYDLAPCSLPLPGAPLEIKQSGFWPGLFASRKTGHPLVSGFAPRDFRYWFGALRGRIQAILSTAILLAEGWETILATGFCQWGKPSQPAAAASERRFGQGKTRLCQVKPVGFTKYNAPAREFAARLLHLSPE